MPEPTHPPIASWQIESEIADTQDDLHHFSVQKNNTKGYLILYPKGHEPDAALYQLLEKTHHDHIPRLLETGHWQQQFYEVHEWIHGGSLQDQDYNTVDQIQHIVKELATALRDLAKLGIRHRNINPAAILIRTTEPLDLVITDFSSARLSDFDLETVAPLTLNRYSAPETIVGAVSMASDWWGLGIILLEQLTQGQCFDQLNDKAFMMHVVTRDVDIPEKLAADLGILLAGLLARDPGQRWQWDEVKLWLAGNPPVAPQRNYQEHHTKQIIQLSDQNIDSPEQFALLAAQRDYWQAGNTLFEQGSLATWCEDNLDDKTIAAQLRQLRSEHQLEKSDTVEINRDIKFSLALMILNPSIPLTYYGDIITPAWLLPNADLSYRLLNSRVIDYLEQLERERWLIGLKLRLDTIRKRSELLDITLDEDKFKIRSLATSRANLDALYTLQREVYPDSDHAGLIDLLDKSRLNDEDLILLLSAQSSDFIPLASIVEEAAALARQHDILSFEADIAEQQLIQPRSELYHQLNKISTDFARCGHAILDGWADDFRLEARLPLPKVLVLLSIPAEQWQKPEKQKYLHNLFRFFEKRITNNIMRGSLVRLTLSRNTAKIDLTEIGTGSRSANSLLEHVLDRGDTRIEIDPKAYKNNYVLERRLERTIKKAFVYRKETGIDTLYIGFPFLLSREKSTLVRPRIAPIFLWPVIAQRYSIEGFCLRFAREREAVRLNPALERILPADQFEKLKKLLKTLLRRNDINISTVLDNVGSLFDVQERELVSHPSTSLRLAVDERYVVASAVLFNATFVGQAISEDLRRLNQLPIQNTALANAFKVENGLDNYKEEDLIETDEPTRKSNQFFITAADPSQETAILRSRYQSGLLVEGPPGTGKSQTIVNIISDCIGRKEKVLVICQKQAALQVVAKRLEAGGLDNRYCMVSDINRDRQSIIRQIREQVQALKQDDHYEARIAQQQWLNLAKKIDRIETSLDQYHHNLYKIDSISERSFRNILSDLIELEEQFDHASDVPVIDVPTLRSLLETIQPNDINALQESISPLANNWLHSNYEDSPLDCFKQFSTDAALINAIQKVLAHFVEIETERADVLNTVRDDFDNGQHEAYQQWLDQYYELFKTLNDKDRKQVSDWFDIFYNELNERSAGEDHLHDLHNQQQLLGKMDARLYHNSISPILQNTEDKDLRAWSKASTALLKTKRWFAVAKNLNTGSFSLKSKRFFNALNPFHRWHKYRIQPLLEQSHTDLNVNDLQLIQRACQLETASRPIRQHISRICGQLDYPQHFAEQSFKQWRQSLKQLIDTLQRSHDISQAVLVCPRKQEATQFIKAATEQSYQGFFEKFQAAITRAAARSKSFDQLAKLYVWISEDWKQERIELIQNNRTNLEALNTIIPALPKLKYYQHFRLDSQQQPKRLFNILQQFREKQDTLLQIDEALLGRVMRMNLRREALLAWKNRLEREHPALLVNQQELKEKITELETVHTEIQQATQQMLHHNILRQRLGNNRRWVEITRLRGARYKRLREFIDDGMDIGLMELRPIWLMNPEVASQALPLKANLFDVVVYDEASQLMVDYAIPTLYRGKRAIISGDEKQMPPTSFFSSRIDSDENPFELELDEDLSASEKAQQEEAWDRHEIKDQSDLLSLGRSFLPTTTLQIHYRSRYEALIRFSNHAFYNGQLNVPSKHPLTEVLRAKPLEVIRVDGLYAEQSNQDEADQVVKTLSEYWQKPKAQRPSIGVVTFNQKQAALISEKIERYAYDNFGFNEAYLEEIQRTHKGDEMGFFVKNVENVQGDERDIMLFSTTFGLDSQGRFHRRFGALGQKGGERRLNVAITRAKQKVILITSMPLHQISDVLATGNYPDKPRDYLQLYLDYASRMSSGEVNSAKLASERLSNARENNIERQDQDGFVKSVAEYLQSQGYQPNFAEKSNDSFQLDLAIEHPKTGLFAIGIECDSPQHYLLESANARELWRPFVLKQSVGAIYRIHSRNWYHDRGAEQQRLLTAVKTALHIKEVEEVSTT